MKIGIGIVVIVVALIGLVMFAGKDQPSHNMSQNISADTGSFDSLKGKPAPDFTLTSYDGKTYSLSQLRGKKVILFFSEGIMCYPACWNQIAALGKDSKLNNEDVVTLSIVPDMRDEWVEAVRRMPDLGKGTILLDSDNAVSNRYGMLSLPSSMHRGSKPGHTYVIVDANGLVRYTQDDVNMGIQNQTLVNELINL